MIDVSKKETIQYSVGIIYKERKIKKKERRREKCKKSILTTQKMQYNTIIGLFPIQCDLTLMWWNLCYFYHENGTRLKATLTNPHQKESVEIATTIVTFPPDNTSTAKIYSSDGFLLSAGRLSLSGREIPIIRNSLS